MNFLAHLYLADDSPYARIGALLPDLVRGPLPTDLNPQIMEAVHQHRRIDAFTDTHHLVSECKQYLGRLAPRLRGIAVDVVFDHVLARDWVPQNAESLRSYIDRIYADFRQHLAWMPAEMRPPIERMRKGDWLGSYATKDGLRRIFTMMSMRLAARLDDAGLDLTLAVDDLADHDEAITSRFHVFFPELQTHVTTVTPDCKRR